MYWNKTKTQIYQQNVIKNGRFDYPTKSKGLDQVGEKAKLAFSNLQNFKI